MALRTTHIAVTGAVVSGYLLAANQPPLVDIVSLAGAWLGTQLPDLDSGNTRLNRKLGGIGRILGKKLKHRTWTHTLWAIILMFILSRLLPVPHFLNLTFHQNYLRIFYQMIAWGYLLHVLEDSFSVAGVCWLYPLQHFRSSRNGHRIRKRRWHWLYYRTGGKEEMLIRIVAWLVCGYFWLQIINSNV